MSKRPSTGPCSNFPSEYIVEAAWERIKHLKNADQTLKNLRRCIHEAYKADTSRRYNTHQLRALNMMEELGLHHDLLDISNKDLSIAIYAANRKIQGAVRESTLSSEMSAVCKLYSQTGKIEDCSGALYRLVRKGTKSMDEDVEIVRATPFTFQENVCRLEFNHNAFPDYVEIVTFMSMTGLR